VIEGRRRVPGARVVAALARGSERAVVHVVALVRGQLRSRPTHPAELLRSDSFAA
jgi:hypothetical protein